MKKFSILFFIILICLIFTACSSNTTSENNSNTAETVQTENPKPDNYIENLNMKDTIQKGFNQLTQLVGHFEREDLPEEEKITWAQETLNRIMPEIQTMTYDMQNDHGGQIYIYTSNGYGSIRNMCDDVINYYQNGDEEALTNFYEQEERASDQLHKAQNEL